MSLIIFFGGTGIVILIGLGVVIHGVYHHSRELPKLKADQKD